MRPVPPLARELHHLQSLERVEKAGRALAGDLRLAAAWCRRLQDLGDREGRPAGHPPGRCLDASWGRRLRDPGAESVGTGEEASPVFFIFLFCFSVASRFRTLTVASGFADAALGSLSDAAR
jgi:hypothetical protein